MGDAGSVRVGVSAVGGEALQERGAFPQALLVFYGVPESKSMFFLVNSIG